MPAPCEAAYLASHIPVTVLVAPSSLSRAAEMYRAIPGARNRLNVLPLRLKEKDLNVERMLTLMAVDRADDRPPLYMEIVRKVLRSMANSSAGFNYKQFRNLLDAEDLMPGQRVPLNLRLEILESFMATSLSERHQDLWEIKPGNLVIVDLSDPFMDEGYAYFWFHNDYLCTDICTELRARCLTSA